eukprot:2799940-Pyramimonas_sp.AAC.1
MRGAGRSEKVWISAGTSPAGPPYSRQITRAVAENKLIPGLLLVEICPCALASSPPLPPPSPVAAATAAAGRDADGGGGDHSYDY